MSMLSNLFHSFPSFCSRRAASSFGTQSATGSISTESNKRHLLQPKTGRDSVRGAQLNRGQKLLAIIVISNIQKIVGSKSECPDTDFFSSVEKYNSTGPNCFGVALLAATPPQFRQEFPFLFSSPFVELSSHTFFSILRNLGFKEIVGPTCSPHIAVVSTSSGVPIHVFAQTQSQRFDKPGVEAPIASGDSYTIGPYTNTLLEEYGIHDSLVTTFYEHSGQYSTRNSLQKINDSEKQKKLIKLKKSSTSTQEYLEYLLLVLEFSINPSEKTNALSEIIKIDNASFIRHRAAKLILEEPDLAKTLNGKKIISMNIDVLEKHIDILEEMKCNSRRCDKNSIRKISYIGIAYDLDLFPQQFLHPILSISQKSIRKAFEKLNKVKLELEHLLSKKGMDEL